MSVVLITGCSQGIGKLTALEFARRGDTVFATMRDTTTAGPLLEEAKAARLSLDLLRLDVTDRKSVEGAVGEAIRRAGRLDVLVNNAAIFSIGSLEDHDDDEIELAFNTNIIGVMRATRAVLPQMRKQSGGTVVMVGSMAGPVAWPPIGVYSETEGAVEALSDALYYELHPFGIRATLVQPGHFDTNMPMYVARRSTEASPYVPHAQPYFVLPSAGRPAGDPRVVAEAIADAAGAENPKRCYLVGDDAVFWCGLHKRLSDEEFEQVLRTATGPWE